MLITPLIESEIDIYYPEYNMELDTFPLTSFELFKKMLGNMFFSTDDFSLESFGTFPKNSYKPSLDL